MAARRAFVPCIAAVLLAAGCSSGGGTHFTPVTARTSATSTPAEATTTTPGAPAAPGNAQKSVEVPNLLGQTLARATQELAARHLVVKVVGAVGIGRVGNVVGQRPAAGGSVPSGSTVRITVLIPSTTGGTGPLNLAANLGSCWIRYPVGALARLNAGVAGLDKMPVPFAATEVRACEYDTTIGSATLFSGGAIPLIATPFGDETNSLPATAKPPRCDRTRRELTFLVTFVNRTNQVTVGEDACGTVTNGARFFSSTPTWRQAASHVAALGNAMKR